MVYSKAVLSAVRKAMTRADLSALNLDKKMAASSALTRVELMDALSV
jgi:hypothetical protein